MGQAICSRNLKKSGFSLVNGIWTKTSVAEGEAIIGEAQEVQQAVAATAVQEEAIEQIDTRAEAPVVAPAEEAACSIIEDIPPEHLEPIEQSQVIDPATSMVALEEEVVASSHTADVVMEDAPIQGEQEIGKRSQGKRSGLGNSSPYLEATSEEEEAEDKYEALAKEIGALTSEIQSLKNDFGMVKHVFRWMIRPPPEKPAGPSGPSKNVAGPFENVVGPSGPVVVDQVAAIESGSIGPAEDLSGPTRPVVTEADLVRAEEEAIAPEPPAPSPIQTPAPSSPPSSSTGPPAPPTLKQPEVKLIRYFQLFNDYRYLHKLPTVQLGQFQGAIALLKVENPVNCSFKVDFATLQIPDTVFLPKLHSLVMDSSVGPLDLLPCLVQQPSLQGFPLIPLSFLLKGWLAASGDGDRSGKPPLAAKRLLLEVNVWQDDQAYHEKKEVSFGGSWHDVNLELALEFFELMEKRMQNALSSWNVKLEPKSFELNPSSPAPLQLDLLPCLVQQPSLQGFPLIPLSFLLKGWLAASGDGDRSGKPPLAAKRLLLEVLESFCKLRVFLIVELSLAVEDLVGSRVIVSLRVEGRRGGIQGVVIPLRGCASRSERDSHGGRVLVATVWVNVCMCVTRRALGGLLTSGLNPGRTELPQALIDQGVILRGSSERFEVLEVSGACSRREDVVWSGGNAEGSLVFAFFVKAMTLGVAFLMRQPDASRFGLEGDTLKGHDRMATNGSVATRLRQPYPSRSWFERGMSGRRVLKATLPLVATSAESVVVRRLFRNASLVGYPRFFVSQARVLVVLGVCPATMCTVEVCIVFLDTLTPVFELYVRLRERRQELGPEFLKVPGMGLQCVRLQSRFDPFEVCPGVGTVVTAIVPVPRVGNGLWWYVVYQSFLVLTWNCVSWRSYGVTFPFNVLYPSPGLGITVVERTSDVELVLLFPHTFLVKGIEEIKKFGYGI
ncbi:hypothetical protein Taro_022358 [Colocasia esculenta]|uniref:Uncharacterized protein n=1 Tax=Colocasia esculenta TaxID=4460 RepID=A0A843V7P3_COLES|nr:hypothetical protein [Colocasia esculenta]